MELDVTVNLRRSLAVLGLSLLTAAVAYTWRPTLHLTDSIGKPKLEEAFPAAFGEWRVDANMPVVLPAPDVQAKLNQIYNQVLSRTYVSPRGERIMLSVAYGGDQSDGTRAHRPEVCYPAQGFQVKSSQVADLSLPEGRTLHVRRLVAQLGPRHEPITYWVMVGDQVATSSTEQKLAQLRFGVKGVIPDGMLIRVSSIDDQTDRAYALQARFVADLQTGIPTASRARIFGG